MNLNYRAKVPVNIKKPTQSAGGFVHGLIMNGAVQAALEYLGNELLAIKHDLSTLSSEKNKEIKDVIRLIEQRFSQVDREVARRIANIDIPQPVQIIHQDGEVKTEVVQSKKELKNFATKNDVSTLKNELQKIRTKVQEVSTKAPDVAIEVIREELSADKQQMIAGLKAETKALKATIDELKKELEESAKSETIEELKRQIQNLSLRVAYNNGGGGGGMGNIKYFRFSGNSATTVFTLPDTPTQEGAAVFVYYNGQRQHPTEHYTVSGRTLTTLFTAETGTYIDGWIIT